MFRVEKKEMAEKLRCMIGEIGEMIAREGGGPEYIDFIRENCRLNVALDVLSENWQNVESKSCRGIEVTREPGTGFAKELKPNTKRSMIIKLWSGMAEWTDNPREMETETSYVDMPSL